MRPNPLPITNSLRGYQGSVHLKRFGVQIQWTPEMVEEYNKCASDYWYFIKNYVYITTADGDEILLSNPYPYQINIIDSIVNNREVIVATARQAGKFLLLDKPLPLYSGGFTTMGDVKVGDVLIDADGKPTTVTFKSDIVIRPTYRITFDDKTTCDAGDEHQWEVRNRFSKHKCEVLTTEQMFKQGWFRQNSRGYKEYRWYIPNTKPIDYQPKQQDIDPYILGIWLGDGTSCNRNLTCDINDVEHYQSQGVVFGKRTYYHDRPNLYTAVLEQLTNDSLNHYNLRNNKHIPDNYLYGSIKQRTRLIQGLFDTDGFIGTNGECSIQLSTRNIRLIDDVHQLLCSMGLKVRRTNHVDKKQNKASIRLTFVCGKDHLIVATIARKHDRQFDVCKKRRYSLSRTIQNIELIESKPAQCISVDNPRRLYLCGKEYLPTHNTTAYIAFILWYILFHKNRTVALLANKAETAREILGRIQFAYEKIPMWMQQGVTEWNKGSIELENNSRVLAGATTKDSFRGFAISVMFIDEAAHVDNWDEFYTSAYNTLSSGKKTKIILVSTPNGLNHFWKTWDLSIQGKNEFKNIMVKWYDVPGRDINWKQRTLAAMNFDQEKFAQDHEVEFQGSSGTLIAGWKLKELHAQIPIVQKDRLSMYQKPLPGHNYVAVADTSRGKGLDYSAMQIIDITSMPYTQVCTYNNNLITPLDYADIIFQMAKYYNNAAVLVENNEIGQQVVDTIWNDFEYENVLSTENAGRQGKRISQGFGGTNERGIRTTKTVKAVGCSILKLLIEQNQLIINDHDTIEQLSRFSKKGKSFEAEPGWHDDLVVGLFLFGWLSDQGYFRELNDINTLANLREKTEEQLLNELTPFGIVDDHQHDEIIEPIITPQRHWMDQ